MKGEYIETVEWVDPIEFEAYAAKWEKSLPNNSLAVEVYANKMLAKLLLDDIVYPIARQIVPGDFFTVVLFVGCNDLFAWACADAEEFSIEDIPLLYKMHMESSVWGAQKWCCLHRKMRPQNPVEEAMKKDGVWDADMESLPPNK